MVRLLIFPTAVATVTLIFSTIASASSANKKTVMPEVKPPISSPIFMAQVVGLQWLNPLQRKDYPTEWQLLWSLGMAGPNQDDEMVESKPKKYRTIQAISNIADANDGKETFSGFHEQYLNEMLYRYRDIYFSDSRYFYNAHSLDDKKTWRELAGIRVEYALPTTRLDPIEAAKVTKDHIKKYFDIGNRNFPNAWTRDTPPDVHVTTGGNMLDSPPSVPAYAI